jgi:hypothetical protein
MTSRPDFDELVGNELSAQERGRLERVHELLVAAGPPPELTPALADPTAEPEAPVMLPRRRAGAVLALAATIALLAFLGGFLAGRTGGEGFSTLRAIPMHGTSAAPNASATIDLGQLDAGGNWPLRVVVRGLKPLQQGYYEMFLTKNGKPVASCGTFRVSGGESTVRLNAPYDLRNFDHHWVVVRSTPESTTHPVVLTT